MNWKSILAALAILAALGTIPSPVQALEPIIQADSTMVLTQEQHRELELWMIADSSNAMSLLSPVIETEVLPPDQKDARATWQRRCMGYFVNHPDHFAKEFKKSLTTAIQEKLRTDPANASVADDLIEKKAAALVQFEYDRRQREAAKFDSDLVGLLRIAVQRRPELFVTEQDREVLLVSMPADHPDFDWVAQPIAPQHHPGEPLHRPTWLEAAKRAHAEGRIVIK